MLERMGYDCASVREKGRKLILPVGDGNLELVLAKAADVVTYVETGVCDMGVVGKDTIMEKGGTFYEIADLGFGKCRFALASVKGMEVYRGYVCDMGVVGKDTIMEKGGTFYEIADLGFGKCRFALASVKGMEVYRGYHTRTIASKYMNVAKRFFESKNMDINLVKIEGSVELAPVLGLADAIVDIVETGTTLKENGLEVIEDICPVSARLIVNIASMKLRKAEVEAFIQKVEADVKSRV